RWTNVPLPPARGQGLSSSSRTSSTPCPITTGMPSFLNHCQYAVDSKDFTNFSNSFISRLPFLVECSLYHHVRVVSLPTVSYAGRLFARERPSPTPRSI